MKILNYENNETYDCYINDDRGYELNLNECGYEKCSPCHYWEGKKKFMNFHYVLSGKGFLIVNGGERLDVKKGEVFFITPSDSVYYEADEEDPWEYIWIGFSGLSAKSIFKHSNLLKTRVHTAVKPNQLFQIYKQIMRSSKRGDVAYLLVVSYLYQFIAYLLDNYGTDKSEVDLDVKQQNLRKIIKMLDSKYKTDISIDGIARLVGYEKTYVYRLFKEYLGISPQRYINYLRVYESVQIKKSDADKSFQQIAYEMGFNDYSTYYRAFKTLVGLYPNEYFERVKGNTLETLHLKAFKDIEKTLDKYRG